MLQFKEFSSKANFLFTFSFSKKNSFQQSMNHYGPANQQKQNFKIVLIGDSGVGKTCLLRAHFHEPFGTKIMMTITPTYWCSDLKCEGGTLIGLQLWDTAGQEKYNSLSRLFYRGADFAFVCFEAGNETSLQNVPKWVESVKEEEAKCKIFFVMTKIDLFPDSVVQEFESHSKETVLNSIEHEFFILTSAKNDEGIDELFDHILQFLPNHKKHKNPAVQEKQGCGC